MRAAHSRRFGELAAGRGRVVFALTMSVGEAGLGCAWHPKPWSAAWVERQLAAADADAAGAEEDEDEEAPGLGGVGL